jgi:hypothetical protein
MRKDGEFKTDDGGYLKASHDLPDRLASLAAEDLSAAAKIGGLGYLRDGCYLMVGQFSQKRDTGSRRRTGFC